MAKRRDKKRGKAGSATVKQAGPLSCISAELRATAWLPRPHPERKRIFFLVSNYTGCGWYRCHVPGVALRERGHMVVLNHEMGPQDLEYFDVFVFQMSAIEDAKNYINAANELGKTTVFELDDDYWSMRQDNPVYEQWAKGESLRLLRECMRACRVVTTTTPYLANVLGRHHPNVVVLPNMLPNQHWDGPRPDHGDKLVVGWAGGASHGRDLDILAGAIEQILDDFPHVEFQAVGMAEYPFRPHERITYLQPVQIEELATLLVRFDIGLAPLVDSYFNRCKSDLKYLEYSMAGAAVIASPVEPYKQTMIHGRNGLFASTSKEWMRELRRVITDAELRKRLATAGHEVAQSRTIANHIHLWEEAYGIR